MTTPTPISISDASSNPDNNLFTVTFNTTHNITTTVTSDPAITTSWLTSLASSTTPLVVGLDIEWRPNFHRNSEHPVATLQLCTITPTTTTTTPTAVAGNTITDGAGAGVSTGTGVTPTAGAGNTPTAGAGSGDTTNFSCLIFQILHCRKPIPKKLIEFLSSDNITFVGVGIRTDVEQLLVDYELKVKNVVELSELVLEKMHGVKKGMGLKELSKVVLGFNVAKPKSVSMSRWDSEWLSYQQIQYACVDAFLSFLIGHKLMS